MFSGATDTEKVITWFLGCSVFQKLPDFTVLCTAHVHKKYNAKHTLRLDFSTAGYIPHSCVILAAILLTILCNNIGFY